jgi:hypothetical protein
MLIYRKLGRVELVLVRFGAGLRGDLGHRVAIVLVVAAWSNVGTKLGGS